MKVFRRAAAAIVIGISVSLSLGGSAVRAAVVFSNISASHVFGEQLTFEADIATTEPIHKLELAFKPNGRSSSLIPVSVSGENHILAEYQISAQSGLPPFTKISFWFLATLESGAQVQSDPQVYSYTDNRYTWQSLDYGMNYHAYWIEGDTAFGQAILDAAINSLTRSEQFLTLPIPEILDIYVYPTAESLQSALEVSGTIWTAGHADLTGSRTFAAIPPSFDNTFDLESTIPHEVTHIRLALLLGDNYSNLPVWLNEGIATLSERYATDSWENMVSAQANGELFNFYQLCAWFPGSGEAAGVAYSQSESLVRFIYSEYGKIGLQSLVDAYTLGHNCENGVLVGLGTSLEDLEDDWYWTTFNQAPPLEGTGELVGWIVFGLIVSISTLALIVFSKKTGDKEEIIDRNGI